MPVAKLTPEEKEYQERMLKKFARRIRQLREDKGYDNHEKFANRYELNRTQVWRYENGEDFRFSSLLKILKAVDISLAEFFGEGFEE